MSAVIENMYQQFCHYVFGAFGLRFGKGVDQRNANGLSYQSNESLSEYSVSSSDDAFEGNREKVLATLRGSQITIPDPQSLLNGWPAAVNPKIERLEGDMQERLKQSAITIHKCKLRACSLTVNTVGSSQNRKKLNDSRRCGALGLLTSGHLGGRMHPTTGYLLGHACHFG